MQRFGYASYKASISAISILFIKNVYLLPENVSTLIEITISKNNQVMVKTSLFWNRIITVTWKNKAEVDGIVMSILYDVNMQIRKEKGLNTHQRVDPSLLWYLNTIGLAIMQV